MVGDIQVVAAQDMGSLGPRQGEAVTVRCPWGDSLRSVSGWIALFLLLFLVGHAVAGALLRWLAGQERFPRWHRAFCLIVGLGPILILGGIEFVLDRSPQFQSTTELMRMLVVLSAALSLPYVVFYGFSLLASKNGFCRRRLAQGFGLAGYFAEGVGSTAA